MWSKSILETTDEIIEDHTESQGGREIEMHI